MSKMELQLHGEIVSASMAFTMKSIRDFGSGQTVSVIESQ
jgi:flagellar biosynthesis protein FliR